MQGNETSVSSLPSLYSNISRSEYSSYLAEDSISLEQWGLTDMTDPLLSDQEGKHKNSGIQKSQKPHEPASSNKPRPKPKPEYAPPPKFEPTFWKGCNRCKTYCEFLRADYLNKSS
ncbi:hypothetical protein DY000_02032030 [Brassica cretica]|uniref:FLZ-type domain-containing protein n=1 Tax=Brassica cretica TaxID=69181 RepID=A0ABQ7DRU6_BRACR|nr:hypothetical protein DY000_02032030 [Brassica cretica]